jgi:hypothetical protein
MVTLDVLTAAPLTIEMLVSRDISEYSRRARPAGRAERSAASERSGRGHRYDGATGIDPAITGEPPEEQAARSARRSPQ